MVITGLVARFTLVFLELERNAIKQSRNQGNWIQMVILPNRNNNVSYPPTQTGKKIIALVVLINNCLLCLWLVMVDDRQILADCFR